MAASRLHLLKRESTPYTSQFQTSNAEMAWNIRQISLRLILSIAWWNSKDREWVYDKFLNLIQQQIKSENMWLDEIGSHRQQTGTYKIKAF